MLKIRVTFVNDEKGQEELKAIIKDLKQQDYTILNESIIYNGRNKSKYSNIYLNIEKRNDIK